VTSRRQDLAVTARTAAAGRSRTRRSPARRTRRSCQLFRILALLIRHPGQLVTREDLRRELWTDETVVDFEHGLNTAIKRGPPERMTPGSALERSPSMAASGSVAFTSISENVDVWRLPVPDHGDATIAEPRRVTDNAARDTTPCVSRHGGVVAFLSSRTGRGEVWVETC
jgi:Transcriptional regulatory protein, C terminal